MKPYHLDALTAIKANPGDALEDLVAGEINVAVVSAALQPYELLNPPKGDVHIIDDVASSGKHIELATIALRQATNYCTTVVWVAD